MTEEKLNTILTYITDKLSDNNQGYRIAFEGDDMQSDDYAAIIVDEWSGVAIINYYYNDFLNSNWEKEVKDFYNDDWEPTAKNFYYVELIKHWKRFEKIDPNISEETHDPCDHFLVAFSDEYSTCDDTGKLIRITADSYHWEPNYWIVDGEIYHGDTVKESYAEEYLESFINENKLLNRSIVDPFMHGWEPIENVFYNGWHSHMNDDPNNILLEAEKHNIDILFTGEPSQFYVKFEVWVKSENLEKATKLFYEQF